MIANTQPLLLRLPSRYGKREDTYFPLRTKLFDQSKEPKKTQNPYKQKKSYRYTIITMFKIFKSESILNELKEFSNTVARSPLS
jgi:hypothetical protein